MEAVTDHVVEHPVKSKRQIKPFKEKANRKRRRVIKLTGVDSPVEFSLFRLGGRGGATADLIIFEVGRRKISVDLTGGGNGGGSVGG